jgi:hypothetical protein
MVFLYYAARLLHSDPQDHALASPLQRILFPVIRILPLNISAMFTHVLSCQQCLANPYRCPSCRIAVEPKLGKLHLGNFMPRMHLVLMYQDM